MSAVAKVNGPAFNQAIRDLQALVDAGKESSPEFNAALRRAWDANPGSRTPVGFYLRDPKYPMGRD